MSEPFDDELDADLAVATISELARPSLYALIMHNDDYTTMEFVIEVLTDVLGVDATNAYLLMMAVHEQGQAKVAELPKEIAEMKVATIESLAVAQDYPLLITLERLD